MTRKMRITLKVAVAGAVLSLASAGAAITPVAGATGPTGAKPIAIKVYKTPECGCCKGWVKHLRDNGFQVETMDMPDLSLIKQKYGVKPAPPLLELRSPGCQWDLPAWRARRSRRMTFTPSITRAAAESTRTGSQVTGKGPPR